LMDDVELPALRRFAEQKRRIVPTVDIAKIDYRMILILQRTFRT